MWSFSKLFLELPDQSAGEAAEVGGEAGNPVGDFRMWVLEGKVGVLIAGADAKGDAAGEGRVESAPDEGRKGRRLADGVAGSPGLVGAAFSYQCFGVNGFFSNMHGVLAAGEDEVRVLRSAEVGSAVGREVDFEAQAAPGGDGQGGIESAESLVVSGYTVEGVGQETVAAVELKAPGGVRLCEQGGRQAKHGCEHEKSRGHAGPRVR